MIYVNVRILLGFHSTSVWMHYFQPHYGTIISQTSLDEEKENIVAKIAKKFEHGLQDVFQTKNMFCKA